MGTDTAPPEDDERVTELESISAIFPELLFDAGDPFTASIDVPVIPTIPIQISFTEQVAVAEALDNGTAAPPIVDTHNLEYLPPLNVKFTLPAGYPTLKPPTFHISTSPPWLPKSLLQNLQADGERMWEDFGHDQVLFAFLDKVQDDARDSFGISSGDIALDLSQNEKVALLDFNIKAKQEAFKKETFDCGICLDPKKGSVCHRMNDCGHVFCRQCLQDFYNNAITTGDLATVRCLAPNCAKERDGNSKSISSKSRKPRKPRTYISPSELLQIPLEHDMVKRYVALKHKSDLESDKDTVYCPRKGCQGGARKKRHWKPEGLEIVDSSDSESEPEEKSPSPKKYIAQDELMRICEDCSFAFCSRCYSSWHGEYFHCSPRKTDGELTEEDQASLEYVRMHTTPCPTCSVPAQKTHGCNHMICFKCATHFCYLCSAWLAPDNPYKHFNVPTQGCYMRLWELEGGDGDDVGMNFGGGVRMEHADVEEENEGEDEDVDGNELAMILAALAARPPLQERQEEVLEPVLPIAVEPVREGPLVLRIDQLPPRPPPQQQVPPPRQPVNRREFAAAHRNARAQVEARARMRVRPANNPVAERGAQRQVINNLPPGEPLQQPQNELIQDARRVLQDVAQRGRQNRNVRQDPGVRQLLQRLPPAHANLNRQELLQQREWLERFVNLALNDEEDEWDSDDDDDGDDDGWAIQFRD